MNNVRKFEPPIRVRFPTAEVDRLKRLSNQYGITVTALIRACVKQALPTVERAIKRQS